MILPGNREHTLPIITYDEIKAVVNIKGRSISSEVQEYFNEFLPYFRDCLSKDPKDLEVVIQLEYFNTKTSKILMDFFGIIKDEVVEKGFNPDVTWHVEKGDEDLIEVVGDYEYLTNIKMKINEISE